MLKGLRSVVFVGVALVAGLACTVGNGSSLSTQPQQQAQITTPTSGLEVTASISAATLGEECGATAAGGSFSATCAPAPSTPPSNLVDSGAGEAGSGDAAKSGLGGCGGPSYCQQSNVQLALTAGATGQTAHIEVVAVTLHNAATGELVDTLTSSKPQVWKDNGYTAWDQTIKPLDNLKASYDLTAPAWSKISNSRQSGLYSTAYRLHVTLRIDGVEVILESHDLNREPMVST